MGPLWNLINHLHPPEWLLSRLLFCERINPLFPLLLFRLLLKQLNQNPNHFTQFFCMSWLSFHIQLLFPRHASDLKSCLLFSDLDLNLECCLEASLSSTFYKPSQTSSFQKVPCSPPSLLHSSSSFFKTVHGKMCLLEKNDAWLFTILAPKLTLLI